MASAKQFLGNKTAGNAKIAALLKTGTKQKIVEVEIKEAPVTKEEVLAVKVKDCDLWIRVNATNVGKFASVWGDDTDKWIGKTFTITHANVDVMGKMQIQLLMEPTRI